MSSLTRGSAHRLIQLSLASLLLLLWGVGCQVTVEHEGSQDGSNRGRRAGLQQQADRMANEALQSGNLAGLSVAVSRDGAVVFAKGYGLADIENDVAATADTVYRIGSITKQFTAAAIMRMIERGQLALDSDLASLLPDFPTEGHRVTVEHLLNHTSGIPSYTSLGDTFWKVSRLDLTHSELLDLVNEPPFDFAPGTEWRYNNSGYYLLGMIIEKVSGQDYAAHLERELFEPLGLEATTYCDERRIIPHRAEGYEVVDGELVNDEMLSMHTPYAAGALCSTVGDLLRWQQALASGEVVSPESYAAMVTPRTLADGSPLTYGFGLAIGSLQEHPVISHGGGINGFATRLAAYPDDALAVVVLTNTPGPAAGPLTDNIASLALGLEIPEAVESE